MRVAVGRVRWSMAGPSIERAGHLPPRTYRGGGPGCPACRRGKAGHPGGADSSTLEPRTAYRGMAGRGSGWEVALLAVALIVYLYGTRYLKSSVRLNVASRKSNTMVVGRRGRPQVSSRAQVEAAAFTLFLERGYAETSIMDIVAAAGISKTTFFRYFPNKAALVWSAFEGGDRDLQCALETVRDDVPVMEALRVGVIDTVAPRLDDEGIWKSRFRILDASQELQAESAQRWSAWYEVVAGFVASRIDSRSTAVVPAGVGGAVQSVVQAVLRESVRSPASRSELLSTLDTSLTSLGRSLQKWIDEQSEQ